MVSISELKKELGNYVVNYLIKQISDIKANQIWIGIGSGTTIHYFIDSLGTAYQSGLFSCSITSISSSFDSEIRCREWKIPIATLADLSPFKQLDYYVDGADEVNEAKQSLKGQGGAHTREKLVGIIAKKFLLLIDETKKVKSLGTKSPVVCEILPFGYNRTIHRLLNKLSPKPNHVELRYGKGTLGPIITENNNFLVDLYYEPAIPTNDFLLFEQQLKAIHGVVETGLFSRPADQVFVAKKNQIIEF